MNSTTKSRWWLYVILSVAVLAVVAPFIWMVLGSFKSEGELRQSPPTWWPQHGLPGQLHAAVLAG